MSFIAEFDIASPIFEETRRVISGLKIEIEDVQLRPGNASTLVCWVDGDDFDTVEDALSTDPTVAAFEILAESRGRRLYRVTLSKAGETSLVYPVAVEHGMTFLEVKGADDGTRISARVPDRTALFAFREALDERDIQFRLKRIYRADDSDETTFGVTERQREVLLYALEEGFFEVPREITLREIASEFDISDQAVSTLCRRGQANLLRHTLVSRGSI